MSMKHLISRTRKAACTLAAAALALSCWPLSAFAADQISMDAPLAASTGATQTQATFAARADQLSVTAPVSMTLAASDGTPLDVRHPENWGALTQSLSFKNNSATKLYLSSATISPAAGAKVVFTGGNLDLALTGTGTSTATAAMPIESTAATGFTMPSDMKTVFALAGSGTATFKLAATLPTANLKSAETLAAAGSLAGATSQLASLSWTFTAIAKTEELFDEDGFYLKIADTQVGQASGEPGIPTSMLGKVFSLDEVKTHSKALGANTASPDVKNLYQALVTSMAPEGDYECYVKYADEAWPVRIIGLRQDVAADNTKGYTADSLVGLTFQFRDLIGDRSPLKAGSNSNAGGWGGENTSDMRTKLNTVTNETDADKKTYLDKMAIKDSIVPVKKYYGSDYREGADNIGWVPDKMFFASWYELTGHFDGYPPYEKYPFYKNEGAGKDHNEQYLFYQNKEIDAVGLYNYKWLVKKSERDWEVSKVMIPSGGNTSVDGGWNEGWWMRSVSPGVSTSFEYVTWGGHIQYVSSGYGWYACPLFCL